MVMSNEIVRTRMVKAIHVRGFNSYAPGCESELDLVMEAKRPMIFDILILADEFPEWTSAGTYRDYLEGIAPLLEQSALVISAASSEREVPVMAHELQRCAGRKLPFIHVGRSIDALAKALDNFVEECQVIESRRAATSGMVCQLQAVGEVLAHGCSVSGRIVMPEAGVAEARFVAPGSKEAGEYRLGKGWAFYPELFQMPACDWPTWARCELSLLCQRPTAVAAS